MTILTSTRGLIAGNPIADEMQLAQFLQAECGAEGFRFEGGMVLALRWNADGSEKIVERFQWHSMASS